MGLNTIPLYEFWNNHELEDGKFDLIQLRFNVFRFHQILSSS